MHAYGMWSNNALPANGQGMEQMMSKGDRKSLSITMTIGEMYAVHSSVVCMQHKGRICIVSIVYVYVL
jgi:hypothetical protein